MIKVEKLTVNSAEGYDSQIICYVHSIPEAIVTWQKNGRNVVPVDNHIHIKKQNHTHFLQIFKTTAADFGNYTCSAVNRQGRSEKHVVLTGTPSPAHFVNSGTDDKGNPVLYWNFESNSVVSDYLLQYRKVGVSNVY